ncbi:MAG: hypothetical protein AAGE94_01995 [Acidobacteriota bacterium]
MRLLPIAEAISDDAVPLWLLGAVAIRATPRVLDELARHPDIRRIDATPPVIASTLASAGTPPAASTAPRRVGWPGRDTGSVGITLLDTGLDPSVASRFGDVVACGARGRVSPRRVIADRHGHGSILSATLGRRAQGAPLSAARVLPGGRGTVAQVIGGLQWALESGSPVIVTPLGRGAFDPLWHRVSWALTAAGTSWVVEADESDVGVHPSIHLPVVGCFRSGPLRTAVQAASPWHVDTEPDAATALIEAGNAESTAARVALTVASLKALGPVSDPLELARLLWATGEGAMARPSPSWAA